MSVYDHTPGPWNYHRPTMAQPSAWIYGQDERPVCELNDNRNEYEANARLIAAAPEMYELLKAYQSAEDLTGFDVGVLLARTAEVLDGCLR